MTQSSAVLDFAQMCEDYIAAGLPPERFWTITPRLYLTEMRGAAMRIQNERGLFWDNAVMSRDGTRLPRRDEYTGRLSTRAKSIPSWESQASAWAAYAATKAVRS